MTRTVRRTWTRNGARVETRHPQVGWLYRGKVVPVRDASAGAFMAWQLVTPDHERSALLVAADYLSAEAALLDAHAELDELVPDDELEDEES